MTLLSVKRVETKPRDGERIDFKMKMQYRSLTCKQACDMMFDYIDGELRPADGELLKKHIDGCEPCSRELKERTEMLALIKLADDAPSPLLRTAVMDSIKDVPQNKKIFAPIGYFSAGTIVAACAVMMVLVVARPFFYTGASMDAADEEAAVGYVYDAAEVVVENDFDDAEEVQASDDRDGAVMFAAAPTSTHAETVTVSEKGLYSVTTASIKAETPKILAVNGTKSNTEAVSEKTVFTADTVYTELDAIIASLNRDDRAVTVCYDGVLDMTTYSGDTESLTFDELTLLRYEFTAHELEAYNAYLTALSDTDADYRTSMPHGEALSYELYIVSRENG